MTKEKQYLVPENLWMSIGNALAAAHFPNFPTGEIIKLIDAIRAVPEYVAPVAEDAVNEPKRNGSE